MSQGLARKVRKLPSTAAKATRIRDSARRSGPIVTSANAAATIVSDAARPNAPVRSHWSAISPITSVAVSADHVPAVRTRAVAQTGTGAASIAGLRA
jgi:hypothetical protein